MSELKLLTHSRMQTYRACPRKHFYRYVLGYVPVREHPALEFGSAIHQGLEIYWLARGGWWGRVWKVCKFRPDDTCPDPIVAMSEAPKIVALSGWARLFAETMLTGYATRWDMIKIAGIIDVEAKFDAALVNPETGKESSYWRRAGKIDAMVQLEDGRRVILEHKTSSEEVRVGSAYRTRLQLDGQISQYYDLANVNGENITGVIYDVLVKPKQRPYKATPIEKQKRTKAGDLHVGQRERDETPEEFSDRLHAAISECPDDYYQQIEVPRLKSDQDDYLLNVWQWAEQMRESEKKQVAPQNSDACFRFGTPCPYFGVCSRTASIEDKSLFKKLDDVNQELKERETG